MLLLQGNHEANNDNRIQLMQLIIIFAVKNYLGAVLMTDSL